VPPAVPELTGRDKVHFRVHEEGGIEQYGHAKGMSGVLSHHGHSARLP